MTSTPMQPTLRSDAEHRTVPRAMPRTGGDGDGVHHFEADLTFGGCRDPRCPTGSVEPTVDMS